MSFLFATSHLPATARLKGIMRGAARPPEEEDEDEEVQATQPEPRSGSVRAFSHLPQSVRAQSDSDGPLSTRPAIPVGHPRPPAEAEEDPGHDFAPDTDHEDTDHSPEPGSDLHDATEDDTGSHEPEDSSPWYQPRITTKDLPPQDHHEDEDEHGHDAGADHPDAAPWGLTDKGEFHDLAYRTQSRPSSPSSFQTVAAASQTPGKTKVPLILPDASGRKDPLAPPVPRKDTSKPDTGGGPRPSSPGGKNDTNASPQNPNPTPAPAGKPATPSAPAPQKGRSNMTVDDDKNSPFAATVRSAMDRELKDSPSSATLLDAVKKLPNKIRIVPKLGGQANTMLEADGTIVIKVNTRDMTGATMSHELAHAVQQAVYYNTLKELAKNGEDPKKKETIDKAVQAGRDALNEVLPLQNKSDQGQEFKENEAMRAGHIVNAERTAAEVGTKIGDTSSMSPEEIAEMFWMEQKKKEDSKHMNNGLIIPKGTKYGDYDYAPVLKSLGHGVTREHLDNARKKVIPNGW